VINLLPFTFWFKLCDTLVYAENLSLQFEGRQAAISATAVFVAEQVACLPITLRALTTLGLLGFQLVVFFRHGKNFVDLTASIRNEEVEQWIRFDLIPLGKLLLSIRSLCLLHFFEQPEVALALDKLYLQDHKTSHIAETIAHT
jgi:hypothetical protein